jgi:hypothetical protein
LGPRAGLDVAMNGKNSHHFLCWELNSGPPFLNPVYVQTLLPLRVRIEIYCITSMHRIPCNSGLFYVVGELGCFRGHRGKLRVE